MGARTKVLTVSATDRAELERRVRSQTAPGRQVKRGRIVLWSAEGYSGAAVAEMVGCSQPTVIHWRRQWERFGLRGLDDRPRSGRPPKVGADKKQAQRPPAPAVAPHVDAASAVTSAEPHLARSVYALRDRRLVTLQRSNGQWTAQATDDGRYFARHGQLPPAPAPDRKHPPATTDNGGQQPPGRLHIDPHHVIDRLKKAPCTWGT